MKSDRPRFADGIVEAIGDGQLSHPELLRCKYCTMRYIGEAHLRILLVDMVKAGILNEVRYTNKLIKFEVTDKEKKRCLNLARKANKGCKEWMEGLPKSWNGQFRSPRSILQSLKG